MKEEEREKLLELVEILEHEAHVYREILDEPSGTVGLKDCFNWVTTQLEEFGEENEKYL